MKYVARAMVAFWGGFSLLAVACSSEGDAPPLPIEQFPQQFAQAYCESLEPCCRKAGIAYQDGECKGSATDHYTELVTFNSGPNVDYDAEAAGQCLKAFKDALSSCVYQGTRFDRICTGVFTGKLSAGEACERPGECSTHTCEEGLCVAPAAPGERAHAKVGEPCEGTCETTASGNVECTGQFQSAVSAACYLADGLYCRSATLDGASPVCEAFLALGEPCEDGVCGPDAYCSYREAALGEDEVPVCKARLDSGPCSSEDTCSAKSYCDGLDDFGGGECQPRKPDGYACDDHRECVTGNCGAGTAEHRACGPGSIANSGSCSGNP